MKINLPKPGIGVLGICLAISGLVYGIFWEAIFNKLLQKLLSLRPNSQIFEFWQAPPMEIPIDVYFFNWTNSEHFYNASIKPRLEQIGPYRFIEKTDKINIRWHPENSTVSYSRRSYYYFDEAGSGGKLNDTIITLNLTPMTAASKIIKWDYFQRKVGALALNLYHDSLILTCTVDELLFRGHEDLFLSTAHKVRGIIKEVLPIDKFGFGYKRNGSIDFWGSYNIYTGVDDFSKRGQIHTWNNKRHNNMFDSYCGMINGTAGEMQKPDLQINKSISIYLPDLCRSLPLDYVEQLDFNGLPSFKYAAGLRAIDNGSLYAENKCFCVDECVPSGAINIQPCWFDTPLYYSYPHFYLADPYYLNSVDGLQPKKLDHELFAIMDPKTGFPQQITGRIQLNAHTKPMPEFRLLKNAPRRFLPILWVDMQIVTPPKIISILQSLPIIVIAGKVVGFSCLLIGLAMSVFDLKLRFVKERKRRSRVFQCKKQFCTENEIYINNNNNSKKKKLLDKLSVIEFVPLLVTRQRARSISMEELHNVVTTDYSPTPSITDSNLSLNFDEEL